MKVLIIRALLVLLSAAVVGCAAVTREPQPAAESAPSTDQTQSPHQTEQPGSPADQKAADSAGFSGELLYKLLAAELAGYRGYLDLSVQGYLAAAEDTGDAAIAERAARIALFAQDDRAALKAARIWVKARPDNAAARQLLAIMLLRAGDIDAAVGVLGQILQQGNGVLPQGFGTISTLLLRESDRQAALRVMGRLAEAHPDVPPAQLGLSRIAEQAGDLAQARAAAERALALQPDSEEIRVQLARVLQNQGDSARALALLSESVQLKPDSRALRLGYARLLVEDKQTEQARAQLEILARREPNNTDLLFTLSVLALQGDDLDTAEKFLSRLASRGERRVEARYYLGQIAENREDYARAIAWYEQVEDSDEHDYYLEANIRIAYLLAKEQGLERALERLHAVSAGSEVQRIRLLLTESEILRDARQYARAMKVLDAAVKDHPNDVDLLYARALMAEKVDRLDVLFKDLRTILDQQPNHAHALNALGYTLADRTSRYQEALQYIERAYALKPNDAAVIDSMGWVQYRLGNFAEAVKYLRRALDLQYDPEIAAHLSEVLAAMGNQAAAREVLERALQEKPDDQLLLEVRKRFEL